MIRSKLLYGLESAQLDLGQLRKLNTFHLKGLRKISRMKTTFVERANTNEEVYKRANEALSQEGSKRKVSPFQEAYKSSKVKRMHRILKSTPSDPVRSTNLDQRGQAWTYAGLRPGRPKTKWAEDAMRLYWQHNREALPVHLRNVVFNPKNILHAEALKQVADNL